MFLGQRQPTPKDRASALGSKRSCEVGDVCLVSDAGTGTGDRCRERNLSQQRPLPADLEILRQGRAGLDRLLIGADGKAARALAEATRAHSASQGRMKLGRDDSRSSPRSCNSADTLFALRRRSDPQDMYQHARAAASMANCAAFGSPCLRAGSPPPTSMLPAYCFSWVRHGGRRPPIALSLLACPI